MIVMSNQNAPEGLIAVAGGLALSLILIVGSCPSVVYAQATPQTGAEVLTSEERPVRVVIQPIYQRFKDEAVTLTEWTAPLYAVVPFLDEWKLSMRGSYASADVDNTPGVSGLTDTQMELSYARAVGDGSLIVSTAFRLPTGKQNLTDGEFDAVTLLSQNFYGFEVPSFGQGVGIRTGGTLALPISDAVVIGVGGSFQFRGGYEPVAGQQAEYDPGDEVRITGGIDVRLTRTSALSGDVSLFTYGTDTVDGQDQFDVGNQISVRTQYVWKTGFRVLRLQASYQGQEKSTLPIVNGADRELQVLPSQGLIRAQYSLPLTDIIRLTVNASSQWYGETTAFDSKALVRIGARPSLQLGDQIHLEPQLAYTSGNITGLEAGLGLTVQQ